MPGTHLLPPNLLKLFAPRPPLNWLRPVDKDINHVRKKNVTGVAHLLSDLKEADTQNLISAGQADTMEEGEEPAFTHAEEIKRQIRREERKAKRHESYKIAKETCMYPLSPLLVPHWWPLLLTSISRQTRR
jgi:U1 small nuclear ribonucleoprotein